MGQHKAIHVYARSKTYVIKVTVTDRAGNKTTVVKRVQIGSGVSCPTQGSERPGADTRRTRQTPARARIGLDAQQEGFGVSAVCGQTGRTMGPRGACVKLNSLVRSPR